MKKNTVKRLLATVSGALLLTFGVCAAVYADELKSPVDAVTVSEAVATVSRMHSAENGTEIPTVGGEWYQSYVDYAVNSGIITAEQFDSYTREIKRYEMAEIIADLYPDFAQINDIDEIPDVSVTEPYEKDVLYLYRAGVLTGTDGYGTFFPFSSLKRNEISAIAERVVNSDKRVQKEFDTVPARYFTDAYLMADAGNGNGRYGIANAWKYDNRFDMLNYTGDNVKSNFFTDKGTEEYMSISRKVNKETEGIVSVELGMLMNGTANGVRASFLSPTMQNIVYFTPIGGKLAMVGNETVVSSIAVSESTATTLVFHLTMDLDKNTATAYVNNQLVGTVTIPDIAFGYIDLHTTKEGMGSVTFHYIRMFKNYVLCEHFVGTTPTSVGYAPAGWTTSGFALEQMISSCFGWTDYEYYDTYSVKTETAAGDVSTASKSFEPIAGKFFFSTYILLPEKTDGASVTLTSAGEDVFKFETKNGKLMCNCTELYDYVDNAWYLLSLDADPHTGVAQVKVNNKIKATVNFKAKYVDGVNIRFAPDKDAVMWFDDVEVQPLVDHYDYPSYPVVASSDNYNIGINICNLWRDSSSAEGWDVIAPFPEMDLYLGYYDEGLREVADWETKWMAEHGIDFMHLCWYSPTSDVTSPIKKSKRAEALQDGFMNSKYSDLLDFCIMWENGIQVDGFETFEEYIWKYWVENYFKDDRYLRLDNKAVITVFNYNNMIDNFGGTEGTKEAIAWMKEDIKNYGYDGLIILLTNKASRTETDYQALRELGIDGTYAYNYGTVGYSSANQINTMEALRKNANDIIPIVPTVSVGFNAIGRKDTRAPFITTENHLEVCEYIKDELETYSTGTWADNTLMVSTWNEYSEGTFVLPSPATNGWALLDNIKNTFTSVTGDHSDVDIMPTQAQKDRVNRTYPKNYSPIRRFRLDENEGIDVASLESVESFVFNAYQSQKYYEEGKGPWGISHSVSSFGIDTSANTLKVVGSAADHGIKTTSNFDGYFAEEAPVIHIKMKTEFADKTEVFFSTVDGKWSSDQYISFYHSKSGEFVDYYVDMTQNSLYKGTIYDLRIDPMNVPGTSEIALIELMNYASDGDDGNAVLVNGHEMTFRPAVEITTDGDFRVTGEARNLGFFSTMRLRYDWDRFTGDGILKLTTYDETVVVLTVGSDKVTVNGVQKDLGYTFSLYDGLPVFEMKKLCDVLGYKYTVNGSNLEIQACSDDEYPLWYEENIDDSTWQFSVPGYSQWTFANIDSWEISDGTLKATPRKFVTGASSNWGKTDPVMYHAVSFTAEDYGTLKIGVKYDSTAMKTQTPQLFFTTSSDSKWNGFTGTQCVNGKYVIPDGAADGDMIEAVFDLSASKTFTGEITGIRFDPFNLANTCYIDYMRFYKTDGTLDETISFEFDSSDDKAGWTFGACIGLQEDGFLILVFNNNNPFIYTSVSFGALEYDTVTVRIKYNSSMVPVNADDTSAMPKMYFTTASATSFTEDKQVTGSYIFDTMDEDGFVDLEFVLSNNENYLGKVTRLRFDPYRKNTAFEIDSIRLSKTEGYEFTDNSLDGWTAGNSTITVENGIVTMVPTQKSDGGYDPFMHHAHTLNCDDYTRISVGVKYIPEIMDKYTPQVFFTTTADTAWTSAKCFTGKYVIPEGTNEGMMIRAEFDLSANDLFTGTLAAIRFDPYHGVGPTCEIDYIRLYK